MGLSPSRGEATSRVEPMNLASSPGNSPTSTIAGQFLPSYLIGGSSSNSPFLWPGSPNKSQQRSFTVSPPSPPNTMQSSTTGHTMPHNHTPRGFAGCLGGEKSSGPPVLGLMDSVHSPVNQSYQTPNTSNIDNSMCGVATPLSSLQRQAVTTMHSRSLFSEGAPCSMSPAQMDPFYTQRDSLTLDEKLDETWVTVFGFPPGAASFILQQFSQYGTIVEHKMEPNGNWVHLHYQSKLQAKKAISKNGKVFAGSIMVGVKSCIEKNLMDESMKENSVVSMGPVGSPARNSTSSVWSDDSHRESVLERSIGQMRPLTQAYRVSASERDVTSPQRTPQKNNNLFSRTMDYMFGW